MECTTITTSAQRRAKTNATNDNTDSKMIIQTLALTYDNALVCGAVDERLNAQHVRKTPTCTRYGPAATKHCCECARMYLYSLMSYAIPNINLALLLSKTPASQQPPALSTLLQLHQSCSSSSSSNAAAATLAPWQSYNAWQKGVQEEQPTSTLAYYMRMQSRGTCCCCRRGRTHTHFFSHSTQQQPRDTHTHMHTADSAIHTHAMITHGVLLHTSPMHTGTQGRPGMQQLLQPKPPKAPSERKVDSTRRLCNPHCRETEASKSDALQQ
jgi:hypothetical protein